MHVLSVYVSVSVLFVCACLYLSVRKGLFRWMLRDYSIWEEMHFTFSLFRPLNMRHIGYHVIYVKVEQ